MGSAGSGWLWDQMRYHPDFWMPPIKEFGYLLGRGNNEVKSRRYDGIYANLKKCANWANRRPGDTRDREFMDEAIAAFEEPIDMDRYVSFFRFKEDVLSGEVTPGYARLDESILAQIAKRLPDTKIILLVRDPIDRAWSRITKRVRKGLIGRAVLEDRDALLEFLDGRKMGEAWFPSQIAAAWRKHAPAMSMRHYFFDDIAKQPDYVRAEIFSYIGADAAKSSGELVAGHNRKEQSEKLLPSEGVKAALTEYFGEELHACAHLFGGAAEGWAAKYGM
jgi:hypothetical protein